MSKNITEFGAKAEDAFDNANALQAAIDAVNAEGGGTVVVPPGRFLSTTIELKSRVTLHLEPGAVLATWPTIDDYPVTQVRSRERHRDHDGRAFIRCAGQESVAITGQGTIDGQGELFWEPSPGERKWIPARHPRVSPLLDLREVKDLRIADITIVNSPGWTVHLFRCDYVWIRGIRIDNNLFGPNTDGLDVNGCRDVMISDCHISCGDDCIVLKTTGDARSCERVTVTNCVLRTNCVALKCGTESWFDFRQILFSNCVAYQCTRLFGLYAFDGGTMEQIEVSNLSGDTDAGFLLNRPLQIDVHQRTPESRCSTVRDVRIRGVNARTDGRIMLTCTEGCRIQRLKLKDVTLVYDRVDDPDTEQSRTSKSLHYPPSMEARVARGAIVAEGLEGLEVSGLSLVWPEEPEVPLSVFWGRRLDGQRLDLEGCRPSLPEAGAIDLA